MKIISIITPCFNEEQNIIECYEAVKEVFKGLKDYDYEHIFADNTSTDNTLKCLRELASRDKRVKVIVNSRNFGPLRSCFNALMSSSGDGAIVMLAADLQDPPDLIPEFISKWEEGHEIVYGIREKRAGNPILSLIKKFYYRLANQASLIHLPPDAGEFQFIDRIVIETLRKYEDYYPYIRGMIASCGFKSIGIKYVWGERKKGYSKSSIFHLIDLALNGLISFSNTPLRICIFGGILLAALSIGYAFSQLILNIIFFRRFVLSGMASLLVGVFFFSGVQLFFLGVLGEYISAIHFQVRKRPMVIERERINFDQNN